MFWTDLDRRLTAHLGGAEQAVVIVSPFIKRPVLQELLAVVRRDVSVKVYTRWLPEEVAAGVSDPEILGLVQAKAGGEVRLLDELHAKLYVADGVRLLLGSANLTAAGLGISRRPNLELLTAAEPAPADIALFLADLRHRSRPATQEEASSVRAAAERLKQLEQPGLAEVPTRFEEAIAPDNWLPSFRSPDRLFGLATDVDWLTNARPGDAALLDLLRIGPHSTADADMFRRRARETLLAAPAIQALDQLLSEPQRFGALTEWLRAVRPEADHATRQLTAQTLIRWLTYFAPDRYSVATPGSYSEVLSLRTNTPD